MKLLIFFLISSSLSCYIDHPIYSIALAYDVYMDNSDFTDEFEPSIYNNTNRIHLEDIIPASQKCSVYYETNLISFEPRINIYSYKTPKAPEYTGIVLAFRGTTKNLNDMGNNLSIYFGSIPSYFFSIITEINNLVIKKGLEVRFVGHSQGGILAALAGYFFDTPSTSIDGPGSLVLMQLIRKYYGIHRSPEDYLRGKHTVINSYPNLINMFNRNTLAREFRLFADIPNSCHLLTPLLKRSNFDIMAIFESPNFSVYFHSLYSFVNTILAHHNELGLVLKEVETNYLFEIVDMKETDNLVFSMFSCLSENQRRGMNFAKFKMKVVEVLLNIENNSMLLE